MDGSDGGIIPIATDEFTNTQDFSNDGVPSDGDDDLSDTVFASLQMRIMGA